MVLTIVTPNRIKKMNKYTHARKRLRELVQPNIILNNWGALNAFCNRRESTLATFQIVFEPDTVRFMNRMQFTPASSFVLLFYSSRPVSHPFSTQTLTLSYAANCQHTLFDMGK